MARPRTRRQTILENALCFDLYRAFEDGELKREFWGFGSLSLCSGRPAFVHSYIAAEFDFRGDLSGWIDLSFRLRGEQVSQRIEAVAAVGRPFGGKRWFLVCPSSDKRVRQLYMPAFGDRFLSRQAYGLRYATERMTREGRDIERVCRLYRKIAGSDPEFGSLNPVPLKRRGMHFGRHEELLAEYARYRDIATSDLKTKLRHHGASLPIGEVRPSSSSRPLLEDQPALRPRRAQYSTT